MASLRSLIYEPGEARGEAVSKAETHTPRIEAPDRVRPGEVFRVRVSVGPHPSRPEHSIRRIEVYFEENGRPFNPIHIASIELEPGYTDASIEVAVRIMKPGVIHALAYCNLHGLWSSSKRIEVIG